MQLAEKFLNGLKQPMIDNCMKVFENMQKMMNDQMTKAGDVVSQTPQAYNSDLYNLAKNINETAVIPIAVLIITFIAIYEIIHLVIDRNNFNDFETFIFFKWIFKTSISIYLVSHAFEFSMAIFDVMQSVIRSASGISIEQFQVGQEAMKASIEKMSIVDLMFFTTQLNAMQMIVWALGIVIWVICVGRIIEMYFIISVSALPFATLTSSRYGHIGDSYIKSAVALGLQGLFIIITLGAWSVFVQSLTVAKNGNPWTFMFSFLAASLLAVIVLFRTKSAASSIVSAA